MIYKIQIAQPVKEATIDLPASKSLSNRALILQALCKEPCELTHLSDCDDTKVMLAAFDKLAATAGTEAEPLTIDIGAAGTSMRFLTAFFASREGAEVIMTGSERMKQRPIKILVEALRSLGAEIEYVNQEGYPPLRIHGKHLAGGTLSIDGSTSSQYISALLMIAPTLTNGLTLTLTGDVTSRPYIHMTLGMMREFGVESQWDEVSNVITVAPQAYTAHSYKVESDWSAASYWYEILALQEFRFNDSPTEHLLLKGLHKQSLQGDAKVAEYFAPLGVETTFCDEGAALKLHVAKEKPKNVELDLSEQPDLAQTIIVTLADKDIHFSIKGLHTLRIKETDRITALEQELRKMDIVVKDEDNDRMYYEGGQVDSEQLSVLIQTYEDHRMAMAFAPLALSWGDIYIENPQVVTKSYPQYWEHLKQIGFEIIENYTLEQIQQDENALNEQAKQEAKEWIRPYKRKLYLRTILGILAILLMLVMLFLLKK